METMCLFKKKPRAKVRVNTVTMATKNPPVKGSKTVISMLVLSRSIFTFRFLTVVDLIF